MNSSTVESLDFQTLEKLSQECSRVVVFNLLDKKTTIEESQNKIVECQIILAEYRKKIMQKHDLPSLKPLEN
jgi:hypothetical protein